MNNKGVSLVELLLVVAIIAIVASLSVPFYRSFQIEEQLNTVSKDALQVLREAQNKSITAQEDSAWGVHFSSTSPDFGTFQGILFAAYYHDNYNVPPSITISTDFGEDIYFEKLTGNPSSAGVVTIEDNIGGSKTITISDVGLINYST